MDPEQQDGQDQTDSEEEQKRKQAEQRAAAPEQAPSVEDADRASRASDAVVGGGGQFAPSGTPGVPGGDRVEGASSGADGGFRVGGGVWGAVDRTLADQPERRPADFRVASGTSTPAVGATSVGGSSAGGTQPATGPAGSPSGFVDPAQTRDPEAVRAAQQALERFRAQTRDNWSAQGYDSQQHMEEVLGNSQSGWLRSVTALARGQLDGGFQGQSWQPGVGWSHDVRGPRPGVANAPAPAASAGGGFTVANPARDARPLAGRDLAGRQEQRAAVAAGSSGPGAASGGAAASGVGSASVAPQPLGAAPRSYGLTGFAPGASQPMMQEPQFQPTAQGRPILDQFGRVVGYR